MILIIKHTLSEGPGLIGDFFERKGYSLKTIELEKGEKIPSGIENIQAVVSMGGPMNVYDEDKYPFLKEEDTFIREILKNNIPFIGVCLGAQILAKALGAKVLKAGEKEIGWYKVPLTCRGIIDPVFENTDNLLDVFQWHEDKFELPENATVLAENSLCFQAFKVNKNAYAFQFHFEIKPEMIKNWLDGIPELSKRDVIKIIKDTYGKKEASCQLAYTILENFSKFIS
ncbi:MAG: type 1 glutamine amidotransferase [Endomicrobiales bacterium]|nr:type 1 glutamine amidotransferase [Endomicrobiales bacterium]